MKIPKEAITKAIEGGWRPHNGADYSKHKLVKAHKSVDFYAEKGNTSSRIDVRYAALDPTFWQALCGWDDSYMIENPSDLINSIRIPKWRAKAIAFYDLILTGQPTEQFWADLLTTSNKEIV